MARLINIWPPLRRRFTRLKKNIDAWQRQLDSGIEVILSSASGCGVMVKDYPKLFDIEDEYHAKALLISAHTQDIAEFLSKEDLSQLHLSEKNISYHEPCTMQHGQQLGGLVESLLGPIWLHTNTGKRLASVLWFCRHLFDISAQAGQRVKIKQDHTFNQIKSRNDCHQQHWLFDAFAKRVSSTC